MIIAKTPFRMSFFGGGTDMKDYFEKNGGGVISTTFDKYCYTNVRTLPNFFEFKSHLTYSKMEFVNEIDEIKHPAIRNALKMMNVDRIRLTYDADLPAKSGLGTSSSFAVGMLQALHALKGEYTSKKQLADEAIYLERILCNENGGWQDQIAAAFGGFNRINFKNNDYTVTPIIIDIERKKVLNNNLMMFFTGFTRFSSDIQKVNKTTSEEKICVLREMYDLVNEAEKILTNKTIPLNEFGKLLDYTWKLKKTTGKAVSTDEIDDIYSCAMKAGATGGKLLGAGGGGFLLFYVEPEYRNYVKNALKNLLYIPFCFEEYGSQIIHYSPED